MNPPFFVLHNNTNWSANENKEYYHRDIPRSTLYLEKYFEGRDRTIHQSIHSSKNSVWSSKI